MHTYISSLEKTSDMLTHDHVVHVRLLNSRWQQNYIRELLLRGVPITARHRDIKLKGYIQYKILEESYKILKHEIL